MNDVHFSSERMDWATPQDFFDKLDKVFNFTLDPCCTKETAKCVKYYTKEDSGLTKSWVNERVFVNPPYGKEIRLWTKKMAEESNKASCIVALLPARVDTAWFHDDIIPFTTHVMFLRGRLKFAGAKHSAPFPSMLAFYNTLLFPLLKL